MKKIIISTIIITSLFVSCSQKWDKKTANEYFLEQTSLDENDIGYDLNNQRKLCECLVESTVPKYATKEQMEEDIINMKFTLEDCVEAVKNGEYTYKDALDSIVRTMNKTCPIIINKDVIVNSIYEETYYGKRYAGFSYKLNNVEYTNLESSKFKDSVLVDLKKEYQKSELLKYFSQNKIPVHRRFTDKNDSFFLTVGTDDK
jgi:hypothetical protein